MEKEPREQEGAAPESPPQPEPVNRPIDPEYREYLAWRRQRRRQRPWYNQGWVWLIVSTLAIVLILWQISGLTGAVQHVADAGLEQANAAREQTEAVREQTEVLREQGNWLLHWLEEIARGLREIPQRLDRLNQLLESNRGG